MKTKDISEQVEVEIHGNSMYIQRTMMNGAIWYVPLTQEDAAKLVKIIVEEFKVCPHCFEIIKGNYCYCMADD